MKKNVTLLLSGFILLFASIALYGDQHDSNKEKWHTICCPSHQICPDQLPIVIKKSGKYCLPRETRFTPTDNGQVAVTIDADDVQLDLCGKRLSQNPVSVIGTIGIRVNSGHKNIAIENGVVSGFGLWGIQVQQGCTHVNVSKITAEANGAHGYVDPTLGVNLSGGIEIGTDISTFDPNNFPITSANTSPCKWITLDSCSFTANGDAASKGSVRGFVGISINELTVSNTHFDENIGSDIQGMLLAVVHNGQFSNSSFDANRATGENAASTVQNARGCAIFGGCSNLNFDTCTFDRNLATNLANRVEGFLLQDANNLTTASVPVSRTVFLGAISNISVNHCTANGIENSKLAATQGAFGFRLFGRVINADGTSPISGVTLSHCEAHDLRYLSSTPASVGNQLNFTAAFAIENLVDGAIIDSCSARNVAAPNAAANVQAYGFAVVSQNLGSATAPNFQIPTNVVIRNSIASGGNAKATISGFAVRDITQQPTPPAPQVAAALIRGVIIENCISENNVSAIAGQAFGVQLFNSPQTKVIGFTSQAHDIGINVLPLLATRCIFEKNLVTDNRLAGFVDATPQPSGNVYKKNQAYHNNNPGFGGIQCPTGPDNNYVIAPGMAVIPAIPIRGWNISGNKLPCTTDNNGIVDPLDNISIV